MANAVPLSELIRVRSRFHRSVHIERDSGSAGRLDYHLAECPKRVIESVRQALSEPRDRAISLIGPYGSGKSALCVHLAQMLGDREHRRRNGAARSADPHKRSGDHAALLPVLIVGSRAPLAATIVAGLLRTLQAPRYGCVREIVERTCPSIRSEQHTPRQVADMLATATSAAREAGLNGMLLIIDELGKLLEFAAQHPSSSDVMVLQEVAEVAVRSGDQPLIVLTVLHQSADAYAHRLGREQQAEWAKVGERFRQLPFFPSDGERMDMVGLSLERTGNISTDAGQRRLAEVWLLEVPSHPGTSRRFVQTAASAYPLHPLALLALPALFRKAGQSHRSVFTFLTSDEPHSLGRFLREANYEPANPPLYSLDRLFDYGAQVLAGGWGSSPLAYQWSEAVESVEHAENLGPDAASVLKAIALMGLLRDPRLPCTLKLLTLAFSGHAGETLDVQRCLDRLVARRLIVRRRFHNTYRLFEGGDADIEGALALARAGLPPGTILRVANLLCPMPRLVARRESHTKGALRIVSGVACSGDQLANALSTNLSGLTLVYCLADDAPSLDSAVTMAVDLTGSPGIAIAAAVVPAVLRDAALDVAACHEVAQSLPELATDRAARRELSAREEEAVATFRSEWAQVFGTSGSAHWYHGGRPVPLARSRDLSELVSRMASQTYSAAPSLRNELLNRESLSSSAAAARRDLIDAMLNRAGQPRLGIEGHPPQASMYECVLAYSGLHRNAEDGGWLFRRPNADDPCGLLPCWDALERALLQGSPGPVAVTELFGMLGAPPYGITAGVLPVLLLAFMLANSGEMTLYREGAFLPEPQVPDWEVLLRRPEQFAVAGARVTGDRLAVVTRLSAGLGTAPAAVPVVRALYREARNLPDYAWRTQRLPANVLALREAFDRAKSPERLLFVDMPAALGCQTLDADTIDPTVQDAFFAGLNAARREWRAAMEAATAEARSALLRSCGLLDDDSGWAALRRSAARLAPLVTDQALQPLLRRAAGGGSDASALESVLAFMANRPPRTWTDADHATCLERAEAIGQLYQVAARESRPDPTTGLSPTQQAQGRELARRIRNEHGCMDPDVLRAALVWALEEVSG